MERDALLLFVEWNERSHLPLRYPVDSLPCKHSATGRTPLQERRSVLNSEETCSQQEERRGKKRDKGGKCRERGEGRRYMKERGKGKREETMGQRWAWTEGVGKRTRHEDKRSM